MSATLDDDAIAGGAVPDPFDLFDHWYAEAKATEVNDPNAMTLATVDPDGMPDARTVLLKDHDPRGFTFYTNYQSAKGRHLAGAPRAALLFHWKSLRRQVRIRGTVEPVTAAEADAYFVTRARESRIGAWASDQSRPAAHRGELMARVASRTAQFEGGEVPRPPHWSGFRVVPVSIEFWQDGAFRLHDRFLYRRHADHWHVQRLFP